MTNPTRLLLLALLGALAHASQERDADAARKQQK